MKKIALVFLSILSTITSFAGIDAVACKGKILPEYKIARLAALNPNGNQAVIKSLSIEKSQNVKKGQEIATLVGIDKAKIDLDLAEATLVKLENLSKLNILKQSQNLMDLKGTFEQNKKILDEKDPPTREREQIEYEQETLLRHMKFSQELLDAIKESEMSNIKEAKLALEASKLHYEQFMIKSPISGVVVEIYSKVGEAVNAEGICELANTNSMYVEAEVYESDVKKIKLNDKAQCLSYALKDKTLTGKVVEISNYVRTNNLFSNNPSDFTNNKVVLVKIALDNPKEVKNLISSQVSVRILLDKGSSKN